MLVFKLPSFSHLRFSKASSIRIPVSFLSLSWHIWEWQWGLLGLAKSNVPSCSSVLTGNLDAEMLPTSWLTDAKQTQILNAWWHVRAILWLHQIHLHVHVRTYTCHILPKHCCNHVHPFMKTMFPDSRNDFPSQQDNTPWHTARMDQEWF